MKILKFISFFILITLCHTNTQCEDDDNFPNNIYIDNDTIIQVEDNQNTYTVGDAIVIETNILLSQTTTSNQEISLADYDYSEPESAYRYHLSLYKLNAFGTLSKIPLTDSSITVIEGNTTVENGSMFIEAFFNGTSYINKASITLPETGTFYLAGKRFLQNSDGKLEILGGVSEFAFVNISSAIVGANTQGGFEFTVN